MDIIKSYAQTHFGGVHYLRSYQQNKPPLVLLHGCPGSSEMYRELMHILSDDFTVFAPDFPGFGSTDAILDQVTIKGFATVTSAFLDSIGLDSVMMFGHFVGAAVAIQLACTFPEKIHRLVLSGTPCLTKEEQKRYASYLAAPLAVSEDGAQLEPMWRTFRADREHAPLELVYRDFCSYLSSGEFTCEIDRAWLHQNIPDQLKRLQHPVTVLAGRNDRMFPYLDACLTYLKLGRKIVLGDACEYLCETHSHDLASIIYGFWQMESTDSMLRGSEGEQKFLEGV